MTMLRGSLFLLLILYLCFIYVVFYSIYLIVKKVDHFYQPVITKVGVGLLKMSPGCYLFPVT